MPQPAPLDLATVAAGSVLSADAALALADLGVEGLPPLLEAAAAFRDRAWGKALTFSPKPRNPPDALATCWLMP